MRLEIYALRFRLNFVRCLRRLDAKFKACEHRRCFKFNRLLVDYKAARRKFRYCAAVQRAQNNTKVAVDRSAKFGACELILSGALQSRACSTAWRTSTRRPFSYRFYASSALQILHKSAAPYKISRELLRHSRANA